MRFPAATRPLHATGPHQFARAFAAGALVVALAGIAVEYWRESAWPQEPTRASHEQPRLVPASRTEIGHGRPRYRHAVVAGGVHSREDVERATREDAVVAAHYDDLSRDSLRPMVTGVDRMAYVSYRIGHRVFWTKRPVRIPRGELILTDGTDTIRARCGNRLSDTPREPVLDVEPAAGELDEVVEGPSVASGPATLGNGMTAGAGAMSGASTSNTVPRVPFLEAVTTALATSPGLIAAAEELVGITPSAAVVLVPVGDLRSSFPASPSVPGSPVGGWAGPGWPSPGETADPSPVAGAPGGETSPGAPTGNDSSPAHESGATGSGPGSGPNPSAGGPGFSPVGSNSPTGAGGGGGSTAGPGGGSSTGGQPASGGSNGSGSNGSGSSGGGSNGGGSDGSSGSNGSSGSATGASSGAGTGSASGAGTAPGNGSSSGSGSETGSGTSNGSSGGGSGSSGGSATGGGSSSTGNGSSSGGGSSSNGGGRGSTGGASGEGADGSSSGGSGAGGANSGGAGPGETPGAEPPGGGFGLGDSGGGGSTGGYGGGFGGGSDWPSDAATAPSVPEPSTWLLFGVGVGVTALRAARSRNRR